MAFVCCVCEKSFTISSNLRRHQREVCRKKEVYRRFECHICANKFIRKTLLERHVKRSHLRIREYECTYCSKQFSTKHELQKHIERKHVVVKKKVAPCDICSETFNSVQNLKLHYRIVHRESFICAECDKKFTEKRSLKAHIRRMHRQHERQKSHICSLCSKKFYEKSDLRQHIQGVHSDNKDELKKTHRKAYTYKCLKCDSRFIASCLIKDHYEEEHGIRLEYDDLTFESVLKFEEWKFEMNRALITQTKKVHEWKTVENTSIKYACHRSGCLSPKRSEGPRQRSMKTGGSKKLGGYCPMEMIVKVNRTDGRCSVKFQKTHVGHTICSEDEFRYTRFSRERKNSTRQISCEVAPKHREETVVPLDDISNVPVDKSSEADEPLRDLSRNKNQSEAGPRSPVNNDNSNLESFRDVISRIEIVECTDAHYQELAEHHLAEAAKYRAEMEKHTQLADYYSAKVPLEKAVSITGPCSAFMEPGMDLYAVISSSDQ